MTLSMTLVRNPLKLPSKAGKFRKSEKIRRGHITERTWVRISLMTEKVQLSNSLKPRTQLEEAARLGHLCAPRRPSRELTGKSAPRTSSYNTIRGSCPAVGCRRKPIQDPSRHVLRTNPGSGKPSSSSVASSPGGNKSVRRK